MPIRNLQSVITAAKAVTETISAAKTAAVTTTATDVSADINVIQCDRHLLRPSSVESVSDVFAPFTKNAKVKVVIQTIGGKTHEAQFDTIAEAEQYRADVLVIAFG